MNDHTPKCGKCGLEVTTGMMAALCPQALACEYWPHSDGTPGMDGAELFMARAWIGNAVEQIGLQIEDRSRLHERLNAALEERDRGLFFDRAVGTTPITHEELMDTTQATPQPAIPFPLADGEFYAGLARDHATGAWHHIVLLPDVIEKDITWQKAIDWATSVGGELPTRFESALLYANARDQIDTDYWYWTGTTHEREPAWAWNQNFDYGGQNLGRKGTHLRARAVRRVPV